MHGALAHSCLAISKMLSVLLPMRLSCGQTTKDITDKYGMTNDIAMAMEQLKNISVRDKGTFKFVQDITGRTPEIHLDPVFLTDFDEYISQTSKA